MGLATLEDVEDGLALGFQLGGLGGVFAEDESPGDEADDEGDEDGGDHRLFGDEFDADERAEVGVGLRGVEGDGDVSAVRLRRFAVPLRESRLKQCVRVSEVGSNHGDFVGLAHRSVMNCPP